MNRTLRKLMQFGWGSVIGQPGSYFGLPHLFRVDRVHLSPVGCDVYLDNKARGIKVVFFCWASGQVKLG